MKMIIYWFLLFLALNVQAKEDFKTYFLEKNKATVVWENGVCGAIINSEKFKIPIHPIVYAKNRQLEGKIHLDLFKKLGASVLGATGKVDGKVLGGDSLLFLPQFDHVRVAFSSSHLKSGKKLEITFQTHSKGAYESKYITETWELGAWMPKILENLDKCEKENSKEGP